MPRTTRRAPGGLVYHVLNRAAARLPLFENHRDYQAFQTVVKEAQERTPIRILAYCLMPNHWHLVLWPTTDGELTGFVRWLTLTHSMRWRTHRGTRGLGCVYQGRFKSFPVQSDEHLYTVLRYVERNPVRAKLVERAEEWPWSSLWARERSVDRILSAWPINRPRDWLQRVNDPLTDAELGETRNSVHRGAPHGEHSWCVNIADRLGLEFALRSRGRPAKRSR